MDAAVTQLARFVADTDVDDLYAPELDQILTVVGAGRDLPARRRRMTYTG